MKKRIFTSLLIGTMMLGLVACGKEGSTSEVEEKKITNIEEAYETEVPAYITSGLIRPIFDEGDGSYQMCIQNTNREEFDAYASLLEKEGFSVHTKKEISAGSAASDKNVFYTYKGKGIHILLSWYPNIGISRIIMTPEELLPSQEKPELKAEDTVTPSVTQMQLDGMGMMYVTQLADGKFIVIDGGVYGLDDMWRLHDYLIEKTPEGKKPTIACWMYTHPDPDHIGLATEFPAKYSEEIALESVAYNFTSEKFTTTGNQDDNTLITAFKVLIKNVKEYYPDAEHYILHAGQSYYFKGLEIEILQTSEELYPNTANVWNDVSASWRMKFDNGQTVMFLGDSMQVLCKQLAKVYGDYLKSDMLQLAHHGLIGGDLELYKYIDPDICFWSTTEERFNGTYTGYDHKYCLGEGGCDYNGYLRDASIKARTHYHNGMMGIVEIK